MIDWGKLFPFKNSGEKAFEEICCQIFRTELGHEGEYRRIGMPGVRQRGVEAVIIKANGKEIGIQAKWFYPGGLSKGNRKKQVEKSLIKAKKRKKLERIIVCMPLILNEKDKTGWGWWSGLMRKLNLHFNLELWDDDQLVTFLTSIKHVGRRLFWFGELEFYNTWFKRKVTSQIKNVGTKYLPGLHVKGDTDKQIHYLIGGTILQYQIKKYKNELKANIDQLEAVWHNIKSNGTFNDKFKHHILTLEQPFVNSTNQLNSFVRETNKFLKFLKIRNYPETIKFRFSIALSDDDRNSCRKLSIAIDEMISQIYQEFGNQALTSTNPRNFIHKLKNLQKEGIEMLKKYSNIMSLIKLFQSQQLIIFSRPGMGKTHLVCYTSENLVNKDKPVILLLGIKFSTPQNLKIQIREQLDIPNQFTWDEIVDALEVAAETYGSRLLFIIDALDESPPGVEIWKNQLAGIISDLTKSAWICTLVTTRESYVDVIFGEAYAQNRYFLSECESIEEFRDRYFKHFKIKLAHLGPNLLKGLRNRFFISLLCKTYGHPSRSTYSKINVRDITIADIFEEYIRKCDNAICRRLNRFTGCDIIREKLLTFAKNIWENNQTSLPKYEAIRLIDGKEPAEVRTNSSYTFGIIHEGLLLDLSWIRGGEVIEFTHPLLGEYLMAVSMIEDKSEKEIKRMLLRKQKHPRSRDVIEWIAFLLPQKLNKHLFEIVLLKDMMKYAQETALFEISPKYLTKSAISWLRERFVKSNTNVKQTILTRLFRTAHIPQYPLNAHFLNMLLKKLPMSDRDIIWSEWIRRNSSILNDHVEYFESISKKRKYL